MQAWARAELLGDTTNAEAYLLIILLHSSLGSAQQKMCTQDAKNSSLPSSSPILLADRFPVSGQILEDPSLGFDQSKRNVLTISALKTVPTATVKFTVRNPH